MTTTQQTSAAPTRRGVRVGYLVSGVVCLGLAGVWALWAAGLADGISVSWLLPAVLLASGVAGLVAMVAAGRRTPAAAPEAGPEPGPEPEPEPTDPTDQTRPYPTQEP